MPPVLVKNKVWRVQCIQSQLSSHSPPSLNAELTVLCRIFRTHTLMGKPSHLSSSGNQVLTIKWHITNLCSKWFHLVALNTERCPKSCCNHEAWTWKREKKTLGGEKNKELRSGQFYTCPLLWNTEIYCSDAPKSQLERNYEILILLRLPPKYILLKESQTRFNGSSPHAEFLLNIICIHVSYSGCLLMAKNYVK